MRFLLALLLCTAILPGQFQSELTTTFSSNNACYGNLFDVTATNDVTVCSFDVNMEAGMGLVRVWAVTGGGSWNQAGVVSTPSAWTLVGSATVNSAGMDAPTPLNLNMGLNIPAGTTQGFCVERDVRAAPTIRYNNGVSYGAVLASNSDLSLLDGGGICTPGNFTPNTTRSFSGTLVYELGLQPTCTLPRAPAQWQVNQPAASLTINGQPDPGQFQPIRQLSSLGASDTLDLASTNVGLPWDAAIDAGGAPIPLSMSGIIVGNQSVNVDLSSPGLGFVFGGVLPDLATTAFPSASFSVPFGLANPTTYAFQTIVTDPASSSGFALSHACEYTAAPCQGSQDFENLSLGAGVAPAGWVNPSSGMPWTVHMGGTTSTGTGPTVAAGGSQYFYCETSGSGQGATFVFDTCPIDVASLTSFTLDFSLSRIGATVGTLEVRMDDGSGTFPILIATYTGADPTQNQGGVEWSSESFGLLPQTATFRLRFAYTAGTSFTGDLAIDEILVR